MTTVVTSFSPEGLRQYGFNFIESFDSLWPRDVQLVLYTEDRMPRPLSHCGRSIALRDLNEIVAFKKFMERYGADPLHRGRVRTAAWKAKDAELGYSFKTDAVKFCRKVFAVQNAMDQDHHGGPLVWIDADVKCLMKPPTGFIEDLLGDAAIAYLGRGRAHSECGFLAFRLPDAIPVIREWAFLYSSGDVFELREWHDSFAFDVARSMNPGVRARDLTPGGVGHVWVRSPLALYMDHLKGERKKLGYSPEHRAQHGEATRTESSRT